MINFLGRNNIKKITSSVGSIGFVKLVSFYKEILIAAIVGVSASYDVFLFYMAVIGLPTAILINPLQTIFIKKIASTHFVNTPRAQSLELKYVVSTLAGLVLFLPLIYISWFVLFQNFISQMGLLDKIDLTRSTIWYFMPYAVVSAINIMLYGYLQAKGKFLSNGFIPILTPLAVILILKLANFSENSLLIGITLGTVAELVFLLFFLKTYLLRFSEISIQPQIVFKFLNLSRGLVFGYLATSIVPLLESSILAVSRTGNLSSYSFGSKLPQAISSIFVTSAAVISLPLFATGFISQAGKVKLQQKFLVATVLILVVGVFVASAMSAISEDLVGLIFSRAKFSTSETFQIGRIQSYFFFQIPFAILAVISSKALAATGQNFTISAVMAASSIGYTLVLSYYGVKWDALQIAQYSTFFCITVSMIYFMIACYKIYGERYE